jgi:flagellar protein FliT
MNRDQVIALYESVADITSKMLAAARNSDWEGLCNLESDCASQVRMLKSVESAAAAENAEKGVLLTDLTDATRLRKRSLIAKKLADDREIRHLTESWMAQLSNLLNRGRVERQLLTAYGRQQAVS